MFTTAKCSNSSKDKRMFGNHEKYMSNHANTVFLYNEWWIQPKNFSNDKQQLKATNQARVGNRGMSFRHNQHTPVHAWHPSRESNEGEVAQANANNTVPVRPPGHPGQVNYQIRHADKRLPTSATSISWPYLARHLPSPHLQNKHEGTHTETIPLIARGNSVTERPAETILASPCKDSEIKKKSRIVPSKF